MCTRVNALGKWRHFISPAKKGFLPISSHSYSKGLNLFYFPFVGVKAIMPPISPTFFLLRIRQILSSDCKHEFTLDLLLTWLFPFSLRIPLYSIFHYQYLFFTPLLYYFPINPSIFAHWPLCSFPYPFSSPIHSILVVHLSLEIQHLSGFSETILLSSCLDWPQILSSFPLKSFRTIFVVSPETQRTAEGKNLSIPPSFEAL